MPSTPDRPGDLPSYPVFDYTALAAQYPTFWPWLLACLFRYDPMDINFGDNHDEYEPEAADLLARLPDLLDEAAVAAAARAVFTFWFGRLKVRDEGIWARLGTEIWTVWRGGMTGLLEAIPGAWEQAQQGRTEAAAGRAIALEDL